VNNLEVRSDCDCGSPVVVMSVALSGGSMDTRRSCTTCTLRCSGWTGAVAHVVRTSTWWFHLRWEIEVAPKNNDVLR